MAGIGTPENDHDTDGILIDVLQSIVRVHDEISFGFDWNQTEFDIEVPDQVLIKPTSIVETDSLLPSEFFKSNLAI
jgi:hypothetical protein